MRTLLRLGAYAEIPEVASRARADLSLDAGTTALTYSFARVAYAALGERELAVSSAERIGVQQTLPLVIRGEMMYHESVAAWLLGDNAQAERLVAAYLDSTIMMRNDAGISRAQMILLRAVLQGAEESYTEQVRSLIEAIGLLSQTKKDIGALASATHMLCALARETVVEARVFDLLERLARTIPWHEDIRDAQTQVLRTTGWAYIMRGDYIRAIRTLSAARHHGNSPLLQILVHLDRAMLAEISKEPLTRNAELRDAQELIQHYDFSAARGEEAAVLAFAAELSADDNPKLAASYVSRARALVPSMSRELCFAHDRRIDALIDYADACVLRAKREGRLAAHRAERAYDVFAEIGYDWRAARCALLLYQVGHPLAAQTGQWLDVAENIMTDYPRSFVATQVIEVGRGRHGDNAREAGLSALSVREREIAVLLADGLTSAEVGARLLISPHTVNVHITRIHRLLNVKRRSELVRFLLPLLHA